MSIIASAQDLGKSDAPEKRFGAGDPRRLPERFAPGCQCGASVVLRLDCGPGGVQYRAYCRTCWRAGAAMPHNYASTRFPDAPDADRGLIDSARTAFARRFYA